MERTKFCCGGQNATMVETLFPVQRVKNGKAAKFFTAVYQCRTCHELTLRGESSQLKAWNTFVEYIDTVRLNELKKEKEQYELAKTGAGEVRASAQA